MSPLRVERQGRVAILTLDRESRANSLSADLLAAFARAKDDVLADPELRALVVTAAGDRAFCAGADLAERKTMSDDAVRARLREYRTALGWLHASPLPVVAAINGAALGGGLELALLCDLRVAAPNAVLGLPETSLGIIPGAGGTQTLTRLLGSARAKELILLARRVSAAEALALGLVHRVSQSRESLLTETLAFIDPIVNGAPIAQAAALEAVDAATELGFEAGLERELELYERCLGSEDRREALLALEQKRPPQFQGR